MQTFEPPSLPPIRNVVLYLLLFVLLLSGISYGFAQSASSQPPNTGTSVLPSDALGGFAIPQYGMTGQRVSVTGQPFTEALHLTTQSRSKFAWDLQLTQRIPVAIAKGDVLVGTFFMRTLKAETGYGRTDLILENRTTYEKSVYYSAIVGSEWRKFTVPFVAVEDEPAGGAQLNFHLGFNPQTIEIGGVTLVNYGKTRNVKDFPITQLSYAGREPGAAWRKAAAARIEKYRKGDLTVVVTDARGRPARNAAIAVRMKRHAFAFGSEISALTFVQETPDAQRYRQTILSSFNKVVFGTALKWPDWEGVWGGSERTAVTQALKILHAHDIDVRGHNLVWPSWVYLPPDLPKLQNDPTALRKRINNHITEEVSALRGQCKEWDVVNEPYDNRTVIELLGGDPIMVEWYDRAHAADPAARLFLNDEGEMENGGDDTTRQETYKKQIALLKAGGHLGGIGVEGHFSQILTPPERLLALLDEYSKFGLPIQANEFDVDVPDPQRQADYQRDFMTVFFSHPNVQGIMIWGFWAPQDWLANAALYRADWTLKPNGKAWYDLVFHRWWTNTDGRTDDRGRYRTRGFLGDYEITVSKGGRTRTVRASVPRNGIVLSIRLP
jgi:GH35 family endo-1,4-beta-xylanase